MEKSRERLSSRLGFILLSVGCAVGLGNIWRFPYIAGKNGGGIFVLTYLLFMFILGLPIMVMEFSVGRASQKSVAYSFKVLKPGDKKWNWFGCFAMVGNYILMMFYTTIAGWVANYLFLTIKGDFVGKTPIEVKNIFSSITASPTQSIFWMMLIVLLGFGICALGLQNGVEKITKVMMVALFLVMFILAIRAVTLSGAIDGIKFFIMPDVSDIKANGVLNVISDAMGQAFFSMSVGMGSMAIFGSYIDKNRRLTGEAINVTVLDIITALLSGFIIFPICSAFSVDVNSGPELVFITLPNIFNDMSFGIFWGAMFFIVMSFAALSTIIAVFENIVSFGVELFKWSRKKSVFVNIIFVIILSIPCALGSNILRFFTPLGSGTTVLDLEDFIVSNNMLPLGALVYVLFCTSKYGWGYKNFLTEANEGEGVKFPKWIKFYISVILPIFIIFLFVQGYIQKFFIK